MVTELTQQGKPNGEDASALPEGAGAGAGGKAEASKKPAESAEAKRVRELEEELREARESERYWAERAKAGAGLDDEPEPDDDTGAHAAGQPDDADADKFLEELTADGLNALKKRGFVKAEDVQRIVDEGISRATKHLQFDGMLLQQFPELADQRSELFKATAPIYRELVKIDPALKNSPATLILAARQAKAELKAKAGPGNRAERIDAQAGDRGRGQQGDDAGDELSPQAKSIIAGLSRFGVTEDGYRKHQEKK